MIFCYYTSSKTGGSKRKESRRRNYTIPSELSTIDQLTRSKIFIHLTSVGNILFLTWLRITNSPDSSWEQRKISDEICLLVCCYGSIASHYSNILRTLAPLKSIYEKLSFFFFEFRYGLPQRITQDDRCFYYWKKFLDFYRFRKQICFYLNEITPRKKLYAVT